LLYPSMIVVSAVCLMSIAAVLPRLRATRVVP
jgi:hypothetical protein